MKLTIFVVLFSFMGGMASQSYSQTTRLTLNVRDVKIEEFLTFIENQSKYRFFYSGKIDVNQKISGDFDNKLINEVLDKALENTGINYEITGRQVILSPTKLTNTVQQQRDVTGKVTDSSGIPLPGVTVVVKGTTHGTITDDEGDYHLSNVPGDATLVFSFVGMKKQEIEVGNQQTVDVALAEDAIGIEEVVAVGYGVQKKKLITGATTQVGGEDIQKMNTTSPMTALQSQTAGVAIIKKSGEPGAGFKVNIRGIGTIGNSQPLYIVDGVPRGRGIDYLNPADIESIDILKDAASAAIYGARAANGVVLVTTKQGKEGKTTVTYDGYYGVQNLYRRLPLLNAEEYAMIQNEANVNSGLRPYDFESLLAPGDWERVQNGTWNGTNWLKAMENSDAPVQNHALNITGGNKTSVYSIGLGYADQEGIFGSPVQSVYERYTLRINSEHVIYAKGRRDIVKFGENLSYSYSEKHGIAQGNMYWNDINSALRTHPFIPLYARDEEGNDIVGEYHYAVPWNSSTPSPIGQMVYSRGMNKSKNNSLNVNVYATAEPIPGLTFRTSFGFSQSGWTYRSYSPTYSLAANSTRTEDQVTQNMGMGNTWIFENTLSYDFSLSDSHNFNVLAGTSAERGGLGEDLSVTNVNSQFDDFEHAYIRNANNTRDGKASIDGKSWGESGLISYFGRVNYDYKETYMATLVMRGDGSSNFAPGRRWGYFPSASAGWVVTNENFMASTQNVLSFLKLRASWGQNGNQSIPAFQYLSLITFNASGTPANYYFDPGKKLPSLGAYPGNIPTPDLSWETSEQLNLGLDARLFDNRLGVAFDLYSKQTKDWLVPAPVLGSWGVTSAPYINGGDISNKGVELALNWNDRISEFSYSISGNVSYNKNEVTRIDNSQGIIDASNVKLWGNGPSIARAQVGYPVGYFWGYETNGIFQNQSQIDNYKNSEEQVIMPAAVPGDVIFVDKNDDGVIDNLDKDMIGDPNPDVLYSLNLNGNYKGFDLSVSTNGVIGNQIVRSWHDAGGPLDNYTTAILGRWHGEGTSNRIPRVQNGSSINYQYTSDLDIEDGDYFRINNITLGYDFKKLFPSVPFQSIRLYLTGQNVYTFTNYSGMDPEIGTSTDDNANGWVSGVDLGFYPNPRTYMVGLSIKF